MKIAIFAILLALTGCATTQLDTGLKGLLGQNVQDAVAVLGYPDGTREVMGDKVYVWSTSSNAMLPLTTTSTAVGSVGTTPYYGTTSSTQFVPVAFQCTVQIAVDSLNNIKSYQWAGNQGGCRRYARNFH